MISSKQKRIDSSAAVNRELLEDSLKNGKSFPLLLAVAHDDVAIAAIKVAHALEMEREAVVSAVQVVDPSPYGTPVMVESMMLAAEYLIGPTATEDRRKEVNEQIKTALGKSVTWPVSYRLGDPTACISDEAHKLHSSLLVIGLHRHGKIARLFGEETTIRAMTTSGIPVIAVNKGLSALPQKILVGVDFGPASVRVAKLAAKLMSSNGEITLAYAQTQTPHIPEDDLQGTEVIQSEGIHAAFSKIVDTIRDESGITAKTLVLEGEPASALIALAEEQNPDMIAVASQRHSLTTMLLLGSVSRTILRDGRWSVLVTPP